MNQRLPAVLPYFFALLLMCGALLTLFASIFTLGSQEQIKHEFQQTGFWPSVNLRFAVVGTFGLVLALVTAVLSVVVRRWHRPSSWAAPKPVLGWAVAVNLLCALGGCLYFVWCGLATPLMD